MRKNTRKLLAAAVALSLTAAMSAQCVLAAEAASGTQAAAMEAPPDKPDGNMGGGPGGNTGSGGSHGSSETVTEDMLKTDADIPEDYDINEDTQGSAKKGEYTFLFDHETIRNVYVTIDENNWNYMLQNAIGKPTVMADTFAVETADGTYSVSYPSIKTKGNLTLGSVWQSDSDRFSFTINISKYIKKKNGYTDTQNLFGMTKVALNDIYGDATLMKEYLSYELMASLGIATPCYSLVNFYVNGEFYGVYMMVESVDSTMTKRTLNESDDYLVKPESPGGDLVYDSALDVYCTETVDEETGRATYTFDFGNLPDEMPADRTNPLYAYAGLWENDEDTFADVKDSLPVVFSWMKTLNELSNAEDPNTEEYKEALEAIVDADSLIRYFAANVYLVNLDSYLSNMMQNYTLYINNNGKATIYPWDYNYSFGAFGAGSASAMVNYSIDSPLLNTTLDERPLLNVILQNDEYKALYETYLQDCCIIASEGGTTSDGTEYAAGNFASLLDLYNEQLNEADGNSYGEDPTAFYTLDRYNEATESFKTLIADRSAAVLRQLAGDMTAVETTVNLSTLGDAAGSGGQPGGGRPGDTDRPFDGEDPGGMGRTLYYGDVDMGGEVTAADALLVLKAVVRLKTIEDGMERALADMDGDGELTAADALEILRTVVKLVEKREFQPSDFVGGEGEMPPEGDMTPPDGEGMMPPEGDMTLPEEV